MDSYPTPVGMNYYTCCMSHSSIHVPIHVTNANCSPFVVAGPVPAREFRPEQTDEAKQAVHRPHYHLVSQSAFKSDVANYKNVSHYPVLPLKCSKSTSVIRILLFLFNLPSSKSSPLRGLLSFHEGVFGQVLVQIFNKNLKCCSQTNPIEPEV